MVAVRHYLRGTHKLLRWLLHIRIKKIKIKKASSTGFRQQSQQNQEENLKGRRFIFFGEILSPKVYACKKSSNLMSSKILGKQ